jgi:polysaccharide export outer membrane protein
MVRRPRRLSLALLAWIVGGTAAALVFAGEAPGPAPAVTAPAAYVVGPGDTLDVKVYDEADLSRTVQVASDGTVSYPLIGMVQVGGNTIREVEEKFRALFAAGYLVEPHVTVTVSDFRSQKVYVLGAVKTPGFYEMTGPTTLLEILSRAGGVLPEGGKTLIVVRGAAGGGEIDPEKATAELPESTLVLDGYKLFQEGDTTQNVLLGPRDVVYVPKAREVFVLGEVKKPGPVTFTAGLTLLQAIGQAGGMTELASPRRVQIVRLQAGKKDARRLNLKAILDQRDPDVPLQPDDVVMVPKRIL